MKESKHNRAVYTNDENGEPHLVKRGICDEEALRIANEIFRKGGTATIVVSEEAKADEKRN